MMRVSNFVLLLGLVWTACAHVDPMVVTAQTMLVQADVFVATADIMDHAYETKVITTDQYKAWANFGMRFQKVYPVLVDAWNVARLVGDKGLEEDSIKRVNALMLELMAFAQQAGAL